METTAPLLHFAEGHVGAVFLVVLATGLLVAGAGFLLRPWPPRRPRLLRFGLIALPCLAALVYASYRRDVVIDVGQRQLSERATYLGLGGAKTWPFAQLDQVWVERVSGQYELGLRGADHGIALRRFDDALEAERWARALADTGGWPAQRRGYELRTSLGGSAGLAGGALESFTTPGGRRGVSVDLRDLVQVVPVDGAESPIGS